MAVLFTVLSLLMTCVEDLFEKKSVTSKTEEVLKTLVWYGIFNIIILCIVLCFGLDETSRLPHELIMQTRGVVLPAVLSCTTLLFALAAYKYVGVSVRNTFANVDGLFYIVILVIFHLVTGKASFAARLFSPSVIIGTVLIISSTLIYPHIKPLHDENEEIHKEKTGVSLPVLGIILALTAALFDGTESVVSSYLIGDDVVDSMDYIAVTTLIQGTIIFFIWIVLSVKEKKIYNPFLKSEKNRFLSQLFCIIGDLLYVFALSDDALISVILWNVFPVLDILGARIFMKEKLNFRQYAVLFTLIIGALFVSLA